MGKSIVSVDYSCGESNIFSETLAGVSGMKWSIYSYPSNYRKKNKKHELLRYVAYVKTGWYLFLHRNEIDNIISWQQFHGILFAFFCRLLGVKKKTNLIIMTFIYKPKKGLIGRIYKCFMTFIVQSKYIDKMIVFSKNEIDYYSTIFNVPVSKFFYTPLSISEGNKPIVDENLRNEKYVFSTGRSNRDYTTLINVFRQIKHPLHIACNELRNNVMSSNIHVYGNMFGDEMRNHMYNSFCVAIALKDSNISSGQLVLLQAMQMGKPIVCTRCSAISDYLRDGYNALLVNTEEEWIQAIERLYADVDLYNTLSLNAYNEYLTNYSSDCMAKSIGKLINDDFYGI